MHPLYMKETLRRTSMIDQGKTNTYIMIDVGKTNTYIHDRSRKH